MSTHALRSRCAGHHDHARLHVAAKPLDQGAQWAPRCIDGMQSGNGLLIEPAQACAIT